MLMVQSPAFKRVLKLILLTLKPNKPKFKSNTVYLSRDESPGIFFALFLCSILAGIKPLKLIILETAVGRPKLEVFTAIVSYLKIEFSPVG